MVPEALELEQERARARAARASGDEAERLLAGQRVGDRFVTAQAAQARCGVGERRRRASPLGGPLEAAMLVEQPHVEMKDAVADDVEAEVAGLDHAGVDRPDGDW